MVKTYSGNLVGTGLRIGIVQARFNDFVSERLLEGALDCLIRHGVDETRIDVIKVPGCFEIPLAARTLVAKGGYNAVVCLGALIRGGTIHFDLIASEVTKGIAQISGESGVPVTFGVITTESIDQAIERAGSKAGNKGSEAALAAIEMANLMKYLS